MSIDLRKSSAAKFAGEAYWGDRDYFRVKVGANARLQITISNYNNVGIKLRITDAYDNLLATTSKRASVYLDGGRSYFIKIQTKTYDTARYQVDLTRYTSEVAKSRLARLTKGVNLPEWFWNITGGTRSTMQDFITPSDVDLIKNLGFNHVRIPVDIKYYLNPLDHTTLDTTYLTELKAGISMFHSAGIATIVCPFGEHQDWLSAGGDAQQAAFDFSRAFSRYLSAFDPELTFLQTTNEPPATGGEWQYIQSQLISILRESAPRHTIITATPLESSDGTFGATGAINELQPYRDTNVVYGLHFYEPFVFTHQGASWAIPGMEFIGGLRFPADFSQTETLSEEFRGQFTGTQYEPIIDLVKYYGLLAWDRSAIQSRFDQATSWASRNGVPMILDEFGVYGANVDDASRYNYLSAVRTIAESAGIGWAMWDYNSQFGIVKETNLGRELRYDVIAALNLEI